MEYWGIFLILLAGVANASADLRNPSKLRAKAENAFVSKDFRKATKYLTQAIELEPENANNYFKRYRIYRRRKMYRQALRDLRVAADLPPTENEVGIRTSYATLLYKTGECSTSISAFAKAIEVSRAKNAAPKKMKRLEEDSQEAAACKNKIVNLESVLGKRMDEYSKSLEKITFDDKSSQFSVDENRLRSAKRILDDLTAVVSYSTIFLMMKAHVQYQLRDYYSVLAETGKVLKVERDNLPARMLRALGHYKMREHDMAKHHIRECLKFDPEHRACKRIHGVVKKIDRFHSKGEAAYESGNYEEAVHLYQQSIDVDETHSEHTKICARRQSDAHMKLKEYSRAKAKAEEALAVDPNDASSHVKLGDALLALEDFDAAVRSMEQAARLQPKDQTYREHIQRAKVALKQSKEINYYKVLGVARDASSREIKRAYRKLAMELHPDRQKGEEAKEKAANEFQKVAQANEILSDSEVRAKYDRGEDVSPGHEQRQQARRGFPFHMFQNGGGGQGGGRKFHFKFG